MSEVVYLNGKWLAKHHAKVSVFDRGFLFGDSIYEAIAVYQGQLFLLDEHLGRLRHSLAAVAIEAPNDAYWQQIFAELIVRNRIHDGLIYLQITRGADTLRSHLPRAHVKPTIFAQVTRHNFLQHQLQPVKVTPLDDIRWQRNDIKATSLLAGIMLKQMAHEDGADEPLLLRDGFITEGASCNYFFVIDGQLVTPPLSHDLLAGVTRAWVLKLAESCGIPVIQKPLNYNACLEQASECFLTSTSREILPIGKISDHSIDHGKIGPITQKLYDLFQQYKAEATTKPLPTQVGVSNAKNTF